MEHTVELLAVIKMEDNLVSRCINEAWIGFQSSGKAIVDLQNGLSDFGYPNCCLPTKIADLAQAVKYELAVSAKPKGTDANESAWLSWAIELVRSKLSFFILNQKAADSPQITNKLILDLWRIVSGCNGDKLPSPNGYYELDTPGMHKLLTPFLDDGSGKNYVTRAFSRGPVTITSLAPSDIPDEKIITAALILSDRPVYLLDEKELVVDWFDEIYDIQVSNWDRTVATKTFFSQILQARDPGCTKKDILVYETAVRTYPNLPGVHLSGSVI